MLSGDWTPQSLPLDIKKYWSAVNICVMGGATEGAILQDVIVSRNKPPVAVIEHKYLGANGAVRKVVGRFDVGDSIYDASGPTKLEAYRDFTIAPDGIIPDMERQTACVRFLNGQVVLTTDRKSVV